MGTLVQLVTGGNSVKLMDVRAKRERKNQELAIVSWLSRREIVGQLTLRDWNFQKPITLANRGSNKVEHFPKMEFSALRRCVFLLISSLRTATKPAPLSYRRHDAIISDEQLAEANYYAIRTDCDVTEGCH